MEFNKGDKGTAILKNFEKVFKEGVHDTWNSPNGLLYKFKLTFDNGLIGVANSKTETGEAYTTGDTYEYTINHKNQYGILLKVGKPQTGGSSSSGYSKRAPQDPDKEYYILMSVAVESAAITVRDLDIHLQRPTEMKACIGTYAKWLLRKTYVEKCNAINIQAALRRAVLLIGVNGQSVDSAETVTIKANELYKSINDNVAWMKTLVQKMLSEESGQNTQNNPTPPEQENSQMKEVNESDMA